MSEPRTQVNGVIVLMDMKGLSFSQVMQFTPSFAKMVVDWIQVSNQLRRLFPNSLIYFWIPTGLKYVITYLLNTILSGKGY